MRWTFLILICLTLFLSTAFSHKYSEAVSKISSKDEILDAKQNKQYVEEVSTSSSVLGTRINDDVMINHRQNNNRKIYLGLAIEPITEDEIAKTEQKLGRSFSILMIYKQWGNLDYRQIDVDTLNMLASHNKIPLISWEPWKPESGVNQDDYRLIKIVKGDFDDYIRESARNLKSFGKPVFLRFAHEMNGNWYPWGGSVNGNSSDDYIRAWRHVFNIFASEEVENVTWVWSPDSSSHPQINGNYLRDYYPGDSYVDWIGLDGYNWGSTRTDKRWESFAEVFSQGYDQAISLSNKPVMIAEFSSSESGGDKAKWIKDALEVQIPNNFSQIKAVVWFNVDRDNSWLIDSSSKALDQIKTSLSNDQYINISATVDNFKIIPPQVF